MSAAVECDIAVMGGGIVGCAIALGLRHPRHRICIVDEGDRAFRASRGDLGMVWAQGKGGFAPYAHLTRAAADAWPAFDAQSQEEAGFGADFYQPGGLGFCLGAAEFEAKAAAMDKLRQDAGGRFSFEMRSAEALRRELPWVTTIWPRTGLTGAVSPGAWLATVHSGITLAPVHAEDPQPGRSADPRRNCRYRHRGHRQVRLIAAVRLYIIFFIVPAAW